MDKKGGKFDTKAFLADAGESQLRVISVNDAKSLFNAWLKSDDQAYDDKRPLSAINFEDELSTEGLLSTYYKKMQAGEPVSLT